MCSIGALGDGTCGGDSGGPLMVLEKDNFVQTGAFILFTEYITLQLKRIGKNFPKFISNNNPNNAPS